MSDPISELGTNIRACRICSDRFSKTATAHEPRPVFWLRDRAPILIAGQAPGARVQESGRPFDDRSGDRLRDWMGIGRDAFYDRDLISILPMAFCFPGYDAKGSDLPPPTVCAHAWHTKVLAALRPVKLTLLVGGYAQKWHLDDLGRGNVTDTVRNWRDHAPLVFALPHPSWRNTGWIAKNPWFAAELLPALRQCVRGILKPVPRANR